MAKKVVSLLIMTVVFGLIYYLCLPALNIHSVGMWGYILILLTIVSAVFMGIDTVDDYEVHKSTVALWVVDGIVLVIFLLAALFGAPLFAAKSYAKVITMPESIPFEEAGISELDLNKLIIADKSVCQQVGARQMGTLTDLVSQYNVSDKYSQITQDGRAVRVSPLEYNGFFKWLNQDSIPGYIKVDTNTMKAEYVDCKITLSPSGYMGDDLRRVLRNKYPTVIFAEDYTQYSFEVDTEGQPYWIVPVYEYNAGLFGAQEITEVIMVNATTGDTERLALKDIPTWVNHALTGDMISKHLDWAGMYKSGFFNCYFGQRNVVCTTEGYGYIHQDDDIYLYTGLTSVAMDESNIGFVLVNTRTEEIKYIEMPSAEEYSAMATAKGTVQEKGYEASFPVLINIDNRPVYFLTLKDDAGLIKGYSFVDAQDYVKVVVSETLEGAFKKYTQNTTETATDFGLDDTDDLGTDNTETDTGNVLTIKEIVSGVVDGYTTYYIKDASGEVYTVRVEAPEKPDVVAEKEEPKETKKVTLTVKEITEVVINGNSIYYVMDDKDDIYTVGIDVSEKIPFIKSGDKLNAEVDEYNAIVAIS